MIFNQIAMNLRGVVSQRLVRTVDGKGRVPVCEIMFNNPIISKLIVERRIDDILQVQRNGVDGMQTFDMHLVQLVKSKTVSMETAIQTVEDEAAFKRMLRGSAAGSDRGGLVGGA